MKPLSKAELSRQRDQLFVKALMANSFNGTQAAIMVGVPPRGAATYASVTLRKPEVQEWLATEVKGVVELHDVNINRLVMELKALAFSSIGDFVKVDDKGQLYADFTDVTPEQLKTIASFKVKERVLKSSSEEDGETTQLIERTTEFRMHNKQAAIVDLIKYLENGAKGLENSTIVNIQNNDNSQHVHVTVEQKSDIYNAMLEGDSS